MLKRKKKTSDSGPGGKKMNALDALEKANSLEKDDKPNAKDGLGDIEKEKLNQMRL